MKNYYNEDVTADSEDILLVGDTFTTVYNDAFKDRQDVYKRQMVIVPSPIIKIFLSLSMNSLLMMTLPSASFVLY